MPSTPDRENDPRYETTIGIKPITDKIERRKVADEIANGTPVQPGDMVTPAYVRSVVDQIQATGAAGAEFAKDVQSIARCQYPAAEGHRVKGLPDPADDGDTITLATLRKATSGLDMSGHRFPLPGVVSARWRTAAILSLCFVAGSIFALTYFGIQHGTTVARLENTIDAQAQEIHDLRTKLGEALYSDFLKLPPATDEQIRELNAKMKGAK